MLCIGHCINILTLIITYIPGGIRQTIIKRNYCLNAPTPQHVYEITHENASKYCSLHSELASGEDIQPSHSLPTPHATFGEESSGGTFLKTMTLLSLQVVERKKVFIDFMTELLGS